MSERTFLFCETGEAWNGNLGKEITESELKRRLAYIAGWPIEEIGSMEREIEVLLHGEGEKEEESPAGLFHGPGLPKKDFDLFNECAAHNKKRPCPICEVPQYKPSPTPTRAEWEEWADECPNFNEDEMGFKPAMFLIEWRRDLKAWIEQMPIVPKE